MASGATGVRLPAYQSATLANGALVVLVEKRDTPLVSMSVTVRGGALGDAAGKDGVASLFADLIQKGKFGRVKAIDGSDQIERIEQIFGLMCESTGIEPPAGRALP